MEQIAPGQRHLSDYCNASRYKPLRDATKRMCAYYRKGCVNERIRHKYCNPRFCGEFVMKNNTRVCAPIGNVRLF